MQIKQAFVRFRSRPQCARRSTAAEKPRPTSSRADCAGCQASATTREDMMSTPDMCRPAAEGAARLRLKVVMLRRSLVRGLVCVLGVVCLLGASAAGAQASSFTPGRVGELDYHLFVPSTADNSRVSLPLVVYLHGCQQTAPDAAVGTRWNAQAEADDFLVLYPQQSTARNPNRCWSWYDSASQSRDRGEAKMIADATRDVMARYRIDGRRVFVVGASAGGAMTQIMAATYPDLYAAAFNGAGCGFASCLDALGLLAYRAMGPRARPVPLMTAAGSLDTLSLIGITTGVQQWLGTSDFADDGTLNFSVNRTPASTVTQPATADSYAYTTQIYNDRHGDELVHSVKAHGAGHVYLGGDPAGSYTDPKGPAYTPLIWAFLSRHPMRAS